MLFDRFGPFVSGRTAIRQKGVDFRRRQRIGCGCRAVPLRRRTRFDQVAVLGQADSRCCTGPKVCIADLRRPGQHNVNLF